MKREFTYDSNVYGGKDDDNKYSKGGDYGNSNYSSSNRKNSYGSDNGNSGYNQSSYTSTKKMPGAWGDVDKATK